jgi:hypothetical protein
MIYCTLVGFQDEPGEIVMRTLDSCIFMCHVLLQEKDEVQEKMST